MICEYCGETFDSKEEFETHVQAHRPSSRFKRTQKSLNITSQYERIFNQENSLDDVFNDRKGIKEVLQYELLKKNVVKASINVLCTFVKPSDDGQESDKITLPLHSKYYTLYRMQTFKKFINLCKTDVMTRLDDLTLRGSGWRIQYIHKMTISTAKMPDLVGGCQDGNDINVKHLKRGRYLVNPPSADNGCFYYCIAHHLTKSMNKNVLADYISDHFNKVTTTGGVRISQIAKFEKQNKHLDIAINVVHCNNTNGTIFPLYSSKNRNAKHRISLLLYFAKTLQDMGHYIYISNFDKYASYRYTKTRKRNVDGEMKVTFETEYVPGYYCHNCLLRFVRKSTFKNHITLCNENQTQKVIIPKKQTFMQFNCLRKSYPLPLVGFCDFESRMVECAYCNVCMDARECTHSTTNVNQHEAFAFCLMIFDRNNELVLEYTYAGDDCVEKLIDYLLQNEDKLKLLFTKCLPLTWTKRERQQYEKSTSCGICGKDIHNTDIKVRHHEHYTGKYISAAHADCNLNARLYDCVIPIFFHNLAGYDVNFIVRALDKVKTGCTVHVLPHNTEKIRKLDLNSYSFMDSLDFLSAGLAELTNDLVLSNHDFPLMKKANMFKTEEERLLLLRKGVFPYSIVRDHVQLLLINQLPKKEDFYSDLTQKHISDEDYKHAQLVWKTFKCKNLLEYCFLYLKLDTILLSESFLKFRNLLIDEENLDACQFLSTPHLSFHLMLKITKVNLEYLSDSSMIFFLNNAIRGGHSYVNVRHAEKNEEENQHLAYWDCKYNRCFLYLMYS